MGERETERERERDRERESPLRRGGTKAVRGAKKEVRYSPLGVWGSLRVNLLSSLGTLGLSFFVREFL